MISKWNMFASMLMCNSSRKLYLCLQCGRRTWIDKQPNTRGVGTLMVVVGLMELDQTKVQIFSETRTKAVRNSTTIHQTFNEVSYQSFIIPIPIEPPSAVVNKIKMVLMTGQYHTQFWYNSQCSSRWTSVSLDNARPCQTEIL